MPLHIAMVGFLDAVDPGQHVDVILAGVSHRVGRARFGLHLRLSRLIEAFDASDDAGHLAGLIREYLTLCGLEPEGSGVELLTAYAVLRSLNAWQWELPFMRDRVEATKAIPYDYPDRTWAWWIHRLASRYGWTRDLIFDLWPEEAACYLQEIFVSEFDEAEERRSLSELAYKYDKGSKTSRYMPLPRPNWMAGREPPTRRRVRRDMVPMGVVIDLSGVVH